MEIISLDAISLDRMDIQDLLRNSAIRCYGKMFGAFENSVIVGIGSIYENKIHPYRDYLAIYIDVKYRGRGFGKTLLEFLKEKSTKKKYQCMCMSTNVSLTSFLEKNNFQLIRKSHTFSLSSPLALSAKKIIVKKIKAISFNDEKELAHLVFLNYTESHKKINMLDLNVTDEVLYGKLIKPYDMTNSSILICDGEIAAYMIVYKENARLEAAYIGGRYKKNIDEYIEYFIIRTNEMLKSEKEILFEIDTTDYYASAFMKSINIECIDSYNTYVAN